MSKSERESRRFSYFDNSTTGIFAKESKISSAAKKLKKKEGSGFWKKCVRFLQGGFSLRKRLLGGKKSGSGTFGKSDDANENEVEINKCREDISKILITSTTSGITISVEKISRDSDVGGAEGAVQQFEVTSPLYRRLSTALVKPSEKDDTAAKDVVWWTKAFKEKQGQKKKEKGRGKRLMWKGRTPEKEKNLGNGGPGSLLASTLFLRRSAEEIANSSILLNPNLRNDCAFLEMKEKLLGERNAKILKVLKTTSEPTWRERAKLVQTFQLHEYLNNLLERFVYLETENIFNPSFAFRFFSKDFSLSHILKSETKSQNKDKTSGFGLENLSREVSPDILVNVKPFKEYVCDRYSSQKGSSTGLFLQNQTHGFGRKNDSNSKWPKKRMNPRRKRGKEGCIHEVLKIRSAPSKEAEFRDREVADFTWFKRNKKTGDLPASYRKDYQEEAFVGLSGRVLPEQPKSTVCGMYKTTSAAKENTNERDRNVSEKKFPSIEYLLGDLCNKDHDVLFRKNLSQFKKKIQLIPRFDLNNSGVKTSQKSVEEPECPKGELDMIKYENLRLWEEVQPQKFLEYSPMWLHLPESQANARTLEPWVEEEVVTWTQTAIKVHQPKESNNHVVVETLENYETKVHLIASTERKPLTEEKDQYLGGRTQAAKSSFSENLTLNHLWPIPGLVGQRSNEGRSVSSFILDVETADKSRESTQEGSPDRENRYRWIKGVKGKSEEATHISEFPSSTVKIMRMSSWNNVTSTSDHKFVYRRKVKSYSRIETRTETLHSYRDNESPLKPESDKQNHLVEERLDSESSDGFKIIYNNNNKESLNDEEDDSNLRKLMSLTGKLRSFVSEEFTNLINTYNKPSRSFYRKMEENPGRKAHRKSNSLPRENALYKEFVLSEHLTRQSLLLSSDVETNVETCQGRKSSSDLGMDIRKTGSALPHSGRPKPRSERAIERRGPCSNLVFSKDLVTVLGQEMGSMKRGSMVFLEDSKVNFGSEVMAACDSISLNARKGREGKEGKKRMSVVILISRK